MFVTVFEIGDSHTPASVRIALDVAHFLAIRQREIGFFLQGFHQLTRYFAEVHVGAAVVRVAATFCAGSRPSITAGIHCLICSGSSEYSIPRNNVLSYRAAKRLRRKSIFSSPQTKLMCGTLLMNERGLFSTPFCT